jgi:integrase
MKALKYFCIRLGRDKKTKHYFWICKKEIAEKYNIHKCVSLGKEYIIALQRYSEILREYNANVKHFNEFGTLPNVNYDIIAEGSLQHVSELYIKSRKFTRLSERTKKDYRYLIDKINYKLLYSVQKKPLGSKMVKDIDRLWCNKLYENLLTNGKNRMASFTIAVLRNLLSTAMDYGFITGENPCTDLRIEKNPPRFQVWSKNEIGLYCKTAAKMQHEGICIAVMLSYHTGQRLTDIMNIKWGDIKSGVWNLKQSKTEAFVQIPISKITTLKSCLDEIECKSEYIVIDGFDDKPYSHRTRLFNDRFDNVKKESGIRKELLFRDLRRTAILALDEAGCTPSEIASISGHSRGTIISMLEIYAPKSLEKAESAIQKTKDYF